MPYSVLKITLNRSLQVVSGQPFVVVVTLWLIVFTWYSGVASLISFRSSEAQSISEDAILHCLICKLSPKRLQQNDLEPIALVGNPSECPTTTLSE